MGVNAVSSIVNDCTVDPNRRPDDGKMLSVNWQNRSATKAVGRDKDVVQAQGNLCVLQLWALDGPMDHVPTLVTW